MYENIRDHIFEKEVVCPVCGNTFRTVAVKTKSPRIQSKDTDFFIRYKSINPYFYDVWLCNKCGYTALKTDFKHLRSFRQELVRSNITPKWNPREYPVILDEKLAIERYKLALLNALLIQMPDSTKAMLSLRIAWMYRLLEDEKQEQNFIKQSVEAFKEAYLQETFPIYGMRRDSFMYLIGELSRRIGDDKEALLWFSKTIVNTNSSYRIKEMARMGKETIKNSSNS